MRKEQGRGNETESTPVAAAAASEECARRRPGATGQIDFGGAKMMWHRVYTPPRWALDHRRRRRRMAVATGGSKGD